MTPCCPSRHAGSSSEGRGISVLFEASLSSFSCQLTGKPLRVCVITDSAPTITPSRRRFQECVDVLRGDASPSARGEACEERIGRSAFARCFYVEICRCFGSVGSFERRAVDRCETGTQVDPKDDAIRCSIRMRRVRVKTDLWESSIL